MLTAMDKVSSILLSSKLLITTKHNKMPTTAILNRKVPAKNVLLFLFMLVICLVHKQNVLAMLQQQGNLHLMTLPDGIDGILGFEPKSSFQCEQDGYFGDVENDCRLFHLCQRQHLPNGHTQWHHWTYACGNQTMFNQLTLTCAFVDEAIPCKHATRFQYLNEVIHRPLEPFLTDADVTSGTSYYGNAILADAARARAFEDSTLMAQLQPNSLSLPQHRPQTQNLNQLDATINNNNEDNSEDASDEDANTSSNEFQAQPNTNFASLQHQDQLAPINQQLFARTRRFQSQQNLPNFQPPDASASDDDSADLATSAQLQPAHTATSQGQPPISSSSQTLNAPQEAQVVSAPIQPIGSQPIQPDQAGFFSIPLPPQQPPAAPLADEWTTRIDGAPASAAGSEQPLAGSELVQPAPDFSAPQTQNQNHQQAVYFSFSTSHNPHDPSSSFVSNTLFGPQVTHTNAGVGLHLVHPPAPGELGSSLPKAFDQPPPVDLMSQLVASGEQSFEVPVTEAPQTFSSLAAEPVLTKETNSNPTTSEPVETHTTTNTLPVTSLQDTAEPTTLTSTTSTTTTTIAPPTPTTTLTTITTTTPTPITTQVSAHVAQKPTVSNQQARQARRLMQNRRSSFQSSRLAAAGNAPINNNISANNLTTASAIIMRSEQPTQAPRSPRADTSQAPQQAHTNSTNQRQARQQPKQQAEVNSNLVDRHGFMAPRFESLVMRRRV